MKPRPFAGHNLVYHGNGEDVADLPCLRIRPGMILSVWELSPEERIAIAEGADLEVVVFTEPIFALAISSEPKDLGAVPRV